ncbi:MULTISPECIES: GNAT family N-acetyltransferase [unclassified Roseovarius]|uniref:GNAT family N-acetyltransferase n=1 Tax=unclassified Roseovarius TaxID=2614913 RepID=UPI00273E7A10|nr:MULTISPECIES: GNAT family N-acetyltransferase [unclassified Roseovarius]
MTAVTIRHGFDPAHRQAAAALYWQAFKGKLGKVMGPDARALAFFEATMDADYALSAVDADGRLLGIAGFKTSEGSLSGGTLRDMTRIYGWFGGTWRGLILSTLERDLAPGVLLMDGICVDADARGLGVGTALLDAIKEHARQADLNSVRLDVIDTNPRARALYERRGFEPMGTTHTGVLRHLFGFRSATTMQCGLT